MRRSIGLLGLTFIGVSGVIGSGWLFSPLLISQMAGPASIVSWIIGAAGMFLLALCFAEVSALVPVAGGIVRIPQVTHGSLTANLLGWTAWIGYSLAAPIETIAMLQYFAVEFPWLYQDQDKLMILAPAGKLIALGLLLCFVLVNAVGARFFVRTNSMMTWVKLLVPLVLASFLIGLRFEPGNFFVQGGFAPDGLRGIFHAISSGGVIFAFLGFRHAIDMSGEVVNPKRTIPLALGLTIVVCFVVYLLMQIAFIGALDPGNLKAGWKGLHFQHDLGPVAGVISGMGIAWLNVLLYAGAVIGPLGASLVATGSNARVGQALAITHLFPKIFYRLSRQGVPLNSLLLNFVIGAVAVFWIPFEECVALNSAAITLSLVSGPIGVYCLRMQLPESERYFRLPLVHLTAFSGFVLVSMIIYWSGWDTVWRLCLALFAGGLVVLVGIVYRGIALRSLDMERAIWLAPYVAGLALLSYLGEFGGGIQIIPFGWDLLVLAAFSAAVFIYAVASRQPGKAAADILHGKSFDT